MSTTDQQLSGEVPTVGESTDDATPLIPMAYARSLPPVHTHTARQTARLGEELPLFCEQCGYNLSGLPVTRCESCQTLHFGCPECGHHQHINTLRPTAQRMIGRLRGWVLAVLVFIKLNWFGWILFLWFVIGYETISRYHYLNSGKSVYNTVAMEWDETMGMFIMGGIFGAVSRIMVIRWKSGWRVGLVLAGLVCLAMMLGGAYKLMERSSYSNTMGYSWDETVFASRIIDIAMGVFAGALVAWPLWILAVHLLLPSRTGQSLIAWQKSLSDPSPDPGLAGKIART